MKPYRARVNSASSPANNGKLCTVHGEFWTSPSADKRYLMVSFDDGTRGTAYLEDELERPTHHLAEEHDRIAAMPPCSRCRGAAHEGTCESPTYPWDWL